MTKDDGENQIDARFADVIHDTLQFSTTRLVFPSVSTTKIR